MSYIPQHKIRIVTAASLFDGHDAAINIMRRILQGKGAEIIHLGHNRSVHEIVEAAIEEDVQGIAITSYQGGHLEFFKYMHDLLQENGCGHIKIFGGGGGTILPDEIRELQRYGITRIYSPDDGRRLGLEGMIEEVIRNCDFPLNGNGHYTVPLTLGEVKDVRTVARRITNAENGVAQPAPLAARAQPTLSGTDGSRVAASSGADGDKATSHVAAPVPVLGITGTGGAGKSSITDEIVRRFLDAYPDKTVAVISVDPSKKKTGGALLGDRIRMNSISHPRVYMRSLATRDSDVALSKYVGDGLNICKQAGYDWILLESAGVGQGDASILDYCDVSLYVMTPEYGAASQLEKINMLDYADVIAINKFDKAGALDALRDVRKQYKRSHGLWEARDEELPVVGTIAAQFNDAGVQEMFDRLVKAMGQKTNPTFPQVDAPVTHKDAATRAPIIPPARVRYLSEISEHIRQYDQWVKEQAQIASTVYQAQGVLKAAAAMRPGITSPSAVISVPVPGTTSPATTDLSKTSPSDATTPGFEAVERLKTDYLHRLHPDCREALERWPAVLEQYRSDYFEYTVRDQVIRQPLTTTSLSGTRIPKVVLPRYRDWGDILRWQWQENLPGYFP
jgi:isobutyryl-CoA mutase